MNSIGEKLALLIFSNLSILSETSKKFLILKSELVDWSDSIVITSLEPLNQLFLNILSEFLSLVLSLMIPIRFIAFD